MRKHYGLPALSRYSTKTSSLRSVGLGDRTPALRRCGDATLKAHGATVRQHGNAVAPQRCWVLAS